MAPDARRDRVLAQAGLTAPAPVRDDVPPARYRLALSGSEGDADALPLLNSHALVLIEQDGWEGFLSALFRPEVHFLPLQPGCADLDLRLAWARAHQDEARQIAQRARRLCARLADPAGRRLHLAQVLADYRRATGQD